MRQTRWIPALVSMMALSAPLLAEGRLPAEGRRPQTPTVVGAVPHLLLPTSANVNGQFGSVYKTKVSILNPTNFDYSIRAGLSTRDGEIASTQIPIRAGETVTFPNILADVFGYYGGGAVDLDSQDSRFKFIVNAQVYVDTFGERYSTSVQFADDAGAIVPGRPGYVVGVSVNSNFRTNVGCASNTSAPQTITFRGFDRDYFSVGAPFTFTLSGYAWAQYAVDLPLTNGGITIETTGNAVCYAVEVNNASNDGTYQLAVPY